MTTKEKNEELNRLQEELRKLNSKLEERVKERTASLMSEVAQRRQAEAAIRASEEKYHSLIDNLPVGIGVSTLDGRVIERNITLQRLFGYESKEEFMSIPVQTLYYDPGDRIRLLELAKKDRLRNLKRDSGERMAPFSGLLLPRQCRQVHRGSHNLSAQSRTLPSANGQKKP